MSNADEIRWQQRHNNLKNALGRLKDACELDDYSELELAGLIQTFEFSFELAWNTLKDLLFYEGFEVNPPDKRYGQVSTLSTSTKMTLRP